MENVSGDVAAMVLAAGMGKRMQSNLPKVLHQIGERSMLDWVLTNIAGAGVSRVCVVLGGDLEAFSLFMAQHPGLTVVRQNQRRGTGDAVAAASLGFSAMSPAPYCDGTMIQGQKIDASHVLICYGDVPGIAPEVLRDFCQACLTTQARLGVIGMQHPQPFGYGRLVQDQKGELIGIVEEKDATDQERLITLCNTGVVFAATAWLSELLMQLNADNAQNEYYLTDCFAISRQQGHPAFVYKSDDWQGFDGVNSPEQLAAVSRVMQQRGFF